MRYFIKKKGFYSIYQGKKQGKPWFMVCFDKNTPIYKRKENAEKVIKKMRAEDYLEVCMIGE